MPKNQYVYNTQTLRYEKVEKSWKHYLLRTLGFICAVLVFAFIIVVLAFQFIESPKERILSNELNGMKYQYEQMNKQLDLYAQVLNDLQGRDDNIYRVIFEAEPIPRNTGIGGSKSKYKTLQNFNNGDLLLKTQKRLDTIGRQLYMQSKSYDDITNLIKNKEDLYASMPAIQPIANKDLRRLASGYGMRIDPIYKTRKMHYGLDFSAPKGTPIYSTGKGKVEKVSKMKRGYGYHIVVNHGYGYKSLYAHCSKILVKKGQEVSRGEIIAEVGSTGKSTANHLHYEVHKTDQKTGRVKKVNPIYYFYNDLSPEEFEKMIEIASSGNQSFD